MKTFSHRDQIDFQGTRGPQGVMGPPGKAGRRVSIKNVQQTL